MYNVVCINVSYRISYENIGDLSTTPAKVYNIYAKKRGIMRKMTRRN